MSKDDNDKKIKRESEDIEISYIDEGDDTSNDIYDVNYDNYEDENHNNKKESTGSSDYAEDWTDIPIKGMLLPEDQLKQRREKNTNSIIKERWDLRMRKGSVFFKGEYFCKNLLDIICTGKLSDRIEARLKLAEEIIYNRVFDSDVIDEMMRIDDFKGEAKTYVGRFRSINGKKIKAYIDILIRNYRRDFGEHINKIISTEVSDTKRKKKTKKKITSTRCDTQSLGRTMTIGKLVNSKLPIVFTANGIVTQPTNVMEEEEYAKTYLSEEEEHNEKQNEEHNEEHDEDKDSLINVNDIRLSQRSTESGMHTESNAQFTITNVKKKSSEQEIKKGTNDPTPFCSFPTVSQPRTQENEQIGRVSSTHTLSQSKSDKVMKEKSPVNQESIQFSQRVDDAESIPSEEFNRFVQAMRNKTCTTGTTDNLISTRKPVDKGTLETYQAPALVETTAYQTRTDTVEPNQYQIDQFNGNQNNSNCTNFYQNGTDQHTFVQDNFVQNGTVQNDTVQNGVNMMYYPGQEQFMYYPNQMYDYQNEVQNYYQPEMGQNYVNPTEQIIGQDNGQFNAQTNVQNDAQTNGTFQFTWNTNGQNNEGQSTGGNSINGFIQRQPEPQYNSTTVNRSEWVLQGYEICQLQPRNDSPRVPYYIQLVNGYYEQKRTREDPVPYGITDPDYPYRTNTGHIIVRQLINWYIETIKNIPEQQSQRELLPDIGILSQHEPTGKLPSVPK